MGHTYYEHRTLIPDGVDVNLDQVYELIQAKFARRDDVTVKRTSPEHIQIQRDEWFYHLHWDQHEEIAEISQHIANKYHDKRDDHEVIASSKCHIYGYGERDPNMDYFNEFVFVQEALEAIPDVYQYQYGIDNVLWKSGEDYP